MTELKYHSEIERDLSELDESKPVTTPISKVLEFAGVEA